MLKLVGSFLSFILHLEYISKLAISDLVMAIFSFQGWMSQLPKTHFFTNDLKGNFDLARLNIIKYTTKF